MCVMNADVKWVHELVLAKGKPVFTAMNLALNPRDGVERGGKQQQGRGKIHKCSQAVGGMIKQLTAKANGEPMPERQNSKNNNRNNRNKGEKRKSPEPADAVAQKVQSQKPKKKKKKSKH